MNHHLGSPLSNPNWLARLSRPTRTVIERVLLALGIILILLQLWIVREEVLRSMESANPPISFPHNWIPDKLEYRAGETIRLKYTRITKFDPEHGPLLIFSLDAFENLTNGEIFSGAMIGRVITESGQVERTAVRHIPNDVTPGEYIFEGWMQAQTSRRTLPVSYQSQPFRISGG